MSAFFSTLPAQVMHQVMHQGITSTLLSKGNVTIGSYELHKVLMKTSGLIKEELVGDIMQEMLTLDHSQQKPFPESCYHSDLALSQDPAL